MARNTETTFKTLKGTRRQSSSRILVPEAKTGLDDLKLRVASDLGINFRTDDYKGNYTAKQCGQVGGEMVRRIIEQVKLDMMNAGTERYQ